MNNFNDNVGSMWFVADLLRGDRRRSEYGKIPLPVPTVEEQRQIAEHLLAETERLTRLVKTSEQQIGKFEECRQALIPAASTDKPLIRAEVAA